ncbi:MAG: FKBP-type peptidyl-prolyl cis-trans isomerase [Pseudomonadales bacterium]
MKYVIAVLIIALAIFFFQRFSANKQSGEVNMQKGLDFLAANKEKEGVQTTASGLQYLVLEAGNGTEHPSASDTVKVHYHGTTIDGAIFDSSVDRGQPISFGLNQVISGWTEGLQLMVVGEKTRLFIPSELAYGSRGAGAAIGPDETLIFDVELLGINE